MKKSYVCTFLAALFTLSLFAACGTSGADSASDNTEKSSSSDKEYNYVEDEVVPIAIKDDFAKDKVITKGFAVENSQEDKSKFTLPKLVADNMLLQGNMTTRIWGKTSETGAVAVQILRKDGGVEGTYYGTTVDGNFLVYLGAHDYGKGYRLKIISESGKCVTPENIAFGELWIGGGQSNMGWQVNQCYDVTTSRLLYQKEINESLNPEIRLFGVTPNQSAVPVEEVVSSMTGGWSEARPQSVAGFSAAAYFFAKELNEQYDIPVWIVQSCMGATGVREWTPASVIGESKNEPSASDSTWYNGMIYPIRNVVARGVLWYQGEGDNNSYDINYSVMMKGWRQTFGRENLWFTTVTLPRYHDYATYFECREQQKKASVEDKYATYSVNIDCGLLIKNVAIGDDLNKDANGNPTGIHPYDKKPVGERAAHVTMRNLYGAKGVWSGPVFEKAEVSGNKIIVTFENVGKGLTLDGTFGFEIGENRKKYTPASVKVVSENKIELWANGVENPVKIRYGYLNQAENLIDSYAECVCLYNTKGDDAHIAYPAEQFVWTKE